MNFPIWMEIFCVLSLLESEKGYFARCFKKNSKKFLSRPIQSVFCDWTAHLLIMYRLSAAQCPEVLFLYLVNCCVINSGKILAGHAKVFRCLCERQTMKQMSVDDLSLQISQSREQLFHSFLTYHSFQCTHRFIDSL